VREGFKDIPEMFTLKLFQSVTSIGGRSTATVELEREGEVFQYTATAEGPCDAAFLAIDKITVRYDRGSPSTPSCRWHQSRGRLFSAVDGREFTGQR
jgi:hypothetical protein